MNKREFLFCGALFSSAWMKVQTAQQFAASKGFQMPSDMGWSEGGTPAGQQALLREALRFFDVAR